MFISSKAISNMKAPHYRLLMRRGGVIKKLCTDHAWAYSGSMPCTGLIKCVFCGKIKDDQRSTGGV